VSTTLDAPPGTPALPPQRQRGPGSGLLLAVGLLLAAICIASGTITLISLLWLRSQTTHLDLAAASTVHVRQSCGGVSVTEGTASTIGLTTKLWMTFNKPKVKTSRSGDTLTISVHCPPFTPGGVSGSAALRLAVPPGTTLDLDSSDGGIHLVGVSGKVIAHSSAGSVRAEDLTSTTVTASSSAGGVHLSFASAPTTVDASSSAGSVSVAVPDDGTAYAVDAHSSAASTHVDLATNPKSTRHITARSSAGSVRVEWR
jgi:hypothetical protein